MADRNAVIHTATGAVLRYGYCDFTADGSFNPTVESQVDLNEGAKLVTPTPAYFHKVVSGDFVEMDQAEQDAVVAAGVPPNQASTELSNFLDVNAHVVDGPSGVEGEFKNMQPLVNRRELYNDPENPLYVAGFTPLLGASGSVTNLNTIHGKLGWHAQQLQQARYRRPKDLLIYYGWLNSFNSAVNGWSNEKVAQDMARYSLIVLGDGVQDPGHGDYSNAQAIIPRIKALNPGTLIFGYVSTNQDLSTFQGKVDNWEALQVHGIFMDESGYDYGRTRSEFNARVDYVHGQTYAQLAMVNAWNLDHVLGTANDASYPNTTYNAGEVESNLTENDWCLLESFPINTAAYTASTPDGYEPKADWASRGVKAIGHRATYGVNLAAVGIISNGHASGDDLFAFQFVSSLMFSLEAVGTSDTNYGAGSAAVDFWTRPSVAAAGRYWSLNPSVQVDGIDADKYWRYVEQGRLALDFSDGAQAAELEGW